MSHNCCGAYNVCTVIWAAVAVGRLAVKVPLYFANDVVALGFESLVLGPALAGGTIYLQLRVLQRTYGCVAQPSSNHER